MTIQKQIEAKRRMRGDDYKPRTRHLREDGWAKYTNRLFLESSPYLLQHAHNPVNWYPWGEDAFVAAKKNNLPVLVSIGYSTCHWCHVMEEESFEDEDIAAYLNQNYIAIKVDREERPDVDSVYMAAVQAITGRGGWPLNVFLTPDRKPFYGGTYFPARDGDRGAPVGFLTILKQLKTAYTDHADMIDQSSHKLTEVVQKMLHLETGKKFPDSKLLHQAINTYKQAFDKQDGGLQGDMKFPSSLPIRLLLRYYHRTHDSDVLHMATHTLEKMAAGGMYDQVGGGFHRYATDRHWLVPHFEKMLYDNALLIMDYLAGFQVTGNLDFKRIVQETLLYVKRDMTSPDGAFYSATDADSLTPNGDREEGYYFTWTPVELEQTLGKKTADIVSAYYAVEKEGNFEGRNILHTPRTTIQLAKYLNIAQDQLHMELEAAKALLYQERNKRPRPLRDEKILTAWNGLMISAHARAGFVLNNDSYTQIAAKTANFIWDKLYIDGHLFRSYNDQQAKYHAYLGDYAFYIAGLLDLFETTQDVDWLKKAIEMEAVLEKTFEDNSSGGFFLTGTAHEALIAREKPNHDGAIPSGNSVAMLNILRLSELTLNDDYRKQAEDGLKAFLGTSSVNPVTLATMLSALDFYLDRPKEIIIVTPNGKESSAVGFLNELRQNYLPNRVMTVAAEGKDFSTKLKVIPLMGKKKALKGKTTAYVCEKGTCELPATDPKEFARQIRKTEKL